MLSYTYTSIPKHQKQATLFIANREIFPPRKIVHVSFRICSDLNSSKEYSIFEFIDSTTSSKKAHIVEFSYLYL